MLAFLSERHVSYPLENLCLTSPFFTKHRDVLTNRINSEISKEQECSDQSNAANPQAGIVVSQDDNGQHKYRCTD